MQQIKDELNCLEENGNLRKIPSVSDKTDGNIIIEGKEYLMQDGDICYFRFNVSK